MERLTLVVLVLAGIAMVLGGWYLYAYTDLLASPPTNVTCNELMRGDSSGVHLLFFGNKEAVQRYTDALLQVEPFNQFKSSFSVSYINSYEPNCELYQGIALLCHTRELVRVASACEHDYIIVLRAESASIRSSSFAKTLSINTNHQASVIAHEFGHAFAHFAEEYTPADLPSSQPNCKSACALFGQAQCYQGCSDSSYFRSSDAGLMRTLSAQNYGDWNTHYLEGLLTKKSSALTGHAIDAS